MVSKSRLLHLACFVISLVCLLWPALDNGYPLVYPDTGTYIASGFDNVVPVDRPIMYALFVRHISMAFSLWLVVIAQAIICTLVLLIIVKHFLRTAHYFIYTCVIIALLSVTTGISYYISQVMPDFLSSMALAGLALLLCIDRPGRASVIFITVLVVFAEMAHSSNLLTVTLIAAVLLLYCLLSSARRQMLKKCGIVLLIVAAGWILTPLLNAMMGAGFTVSRATNIFLMGRLSESGVLNTYLHEHCPDQQLPLCRSMDHLPDVSFHFLWDHDSPLYDGGCLDAEGHHSPCWLAKNEEYKPVIHAIFTTPRYLGMYAAFAAKQSAEQLLDFKNDPLGPMLEGSPVMGNIEWRYKRELSQYTHSKQSQGPYTMTTNSYIQYATTALSLVFLLLCFSVKTIRSSFPSYLWRFMLITCLGIFFNAMVCATFSMVASRFQGRIIWLIVFSAALAVCIRWLKKTPAQTSEIV